MNSRERVLTSLNYKQPDKVAVDFGGHRSSGIMIQAYKNLREYLGLPASEIFVHDFIQQLVIVEDDVLDIVGSDVIEMGHDLIEIPSYWKDWETQDGIKCKIPAYIDVKKTNDGYVIYDELKDSISIQKNGCLYFEQLREPYRDSDEEEFDNLENDLKKVMWFSINTPPYPVPLDGEGKKIWRETARKLRNRTDKAIYGLFGAGLFEIGQRAFGIDEFMCEMALNPERVHRFLDKMLEYHLKSLQKYLDAVGDYIDVISFGDDLGMQSGTQISPKMFKEFFKPRYEILWNYHKKMYPNIKTNLHSCGSIYAFMEDLIDDGLDSVNPVQISAKNMEPQRLKSEFGGRISFWGGGCDTQQVLRIGSIDEIKDHVKRNLEILAPGGGFVFQQVHNVMADVRPEALMAMFETVKEWRY